jgi:hypothetical protein
MVTFNITIGGFKKMNELEKVLEDNNVPVVSNVDEVMETLFAHNKVLASRNRPYHGQRWIPIGDRGKEEVRGLTMRDVEDCVAAGLLLLGGCDELRDKVNHHMNGGETTWCYEDLYDKRLDYNKMDPVALLQNIGCFIEMYMGIFPNTNKINMVETTKEPALTYDTK